MRVRSLTQPRAGVRLLKLVAGHFPTGGAGSLCRRSLNPAFGSNQ